jgi:hypothetical protein
VLPDLNNAVKKLTVLLAFSLILIFWSQRTGVADSHIFHKAVSLRAPISHLPAFVLQETPYYLSFFYRLG